jgi:hypothetical protein
MDLASGEGLIQLGVCRSITSAVALEILSETGGDDRTINPSDTCRSIDPRGFVEKFRILPPCTKIKKETREPTRESIELASSVSEATATSGEE